jgi:hypothetical protein
MESSKPKFIGMNSLTANILCRVHNNALSTVDVEGVRAFRAIRCFEEILSLRQALTDAADLQHNADGLLLERWFLKHAVNLFVVSGSNRRWPGGFVPPPYPASAGCATAAGSCRTRLAPPSRCLS